MVAHTEDEARKKGSKFCAKFKEEHIREICDKYIDEAIFILRAAAEKCSAPVKGGKYEHSVHFLKVQIIAAFLLRSCLFDAAEGGGKKDMNTLVTTLWNSSCSSA